uniref:Putative secreted peptide n=1 Tax=Anopheles braziliensis TaxID=58242 RepID=A0A2M3ZTS4_9DIPT
MLWFNYHLQLCLAFVILLRRHTFSSLRPMSIRCVLQLKSATKCARFIDLLYSEPVLKTDKSMALHYDGSKIAP